MKRNEQYSTYHRKKKQRFESAWVLGVYNAYNRANPFFLIPSQKTDDATGVTKTVFKKVSILPIIPNISYQFKF